MQRTPSRFARFLNDKKALDATYEFVEHENELDDVNMPDSNRAAFPSEMRLNIPGWPIAPLPLRRASHVKRYGAVLFLLLPLPFIGLIISALALRNKPITDGGKSLLRAMQLGPTIFPLFFAAIAGRTLKTIALWKVERGTTVGTMEKLLGSHSVVNAIGHAVSLQSFDLLTVALLLLWALSPIGGQGSLRLLYVSNSTTVTDNYPTMYTMADLTVPHIRDSSAEVWADLVPRFESDHIMTASLTVSEALRNNSVDPWGRPKIPSLKSINEKSATDWVAVDRNADTAFTSLVGLGVFDTYGFAESIDLGDTLNFTAPYEYLHSECKPKSAVNLTDVRNFTRSYGLLGPALSNDTMGRTNGSDIWAPLHSPRNSRTGGKLLAYFFLAAVSSEDVSRPTNDGFAPLVFGLFGADGVSIYDCSLRTIRIDAAIRCSPQNCITEAIRPATTTDNTVCSRSSTSGCLSDLAKPFSLPLQRFLQFFPTAMSGINEYNSPIYNYFYDFPPLPARNFVQRPEERDWSSVPDALLSARLTTMLNTFWYAWIWNDEVYTRSGFDPNRNDLANATLTKIQPVYKVNTGWAVALFFSSIILLLLGMVNCYYVWKIDGLDPFGYMSTILRDGLDSNVPKTASALSGEELARLLARERVQLMDVRPDDEAGRIALRVTGKHDLSRTQLDRTRLYV